MSHAELDEAEELGCDYTALKRLLPNPTVLGGGCGTDHRHVAAIAERCIAHDAA